MDRQVFTYRTPITYLVGAFLTIWVTGWTCGLIANTPWNGGHFKINGHLASHQEAVSMYWVFLGIDIAVLVGLGCWVAFVKNARIEVSDGELRSIGMSGREKVRIPLNAIDPPRVMYAQPRIGGTVNWKDEVQAFSSVDTGGKWYEKLDVTSPYGGIRVYSNSTTRYTELKRLLFNASKR